MRDRLLLARDLLTPSGSVFVQISDENLHHVRELMDQVFGAENFVSVVTFKKTASSVASGIASISDYLLSYSRDSQHVKVRKVFEPRGLEDDTGNRYTRIELPARSVAQVREILDAGGD